MDDVTKRSKEQISQLREISHQREQQCWELYLRCWTQERIAKELGIAREQVSRYQRRSKQRLNENLAEKVSAYKTDQLDKLGLILAESLRAWHATPNKPNPKFLTEARGALKDIRDLMGLDKQTESNSLVVEDIIRAFATPTTQEPLDNK